MERAFPRLKSSPYAVTSDATPKYNCIAWALGDDKRIWWPNGTAFWPPEVPLEETVEAFRSLFALHGFIECTSEAMEAGVEKVALFTSSRGIPTHAARQLRSGMWTSKLGASVDIAHRLRGLEGKEYGQAILIYSRRIETVSPGDATSPTAPEQLP